MRHRTAKDHAVRLKLNYVLVVLFKMKTLVVNELIKLSINHQLTINYASKSKKKKFKFKNKLYNIYALRTKNSK